MSILSAPVFEGALYIKSVLKAFTEFLDKEGTSAPDSNEQDSINQDIQAIKIHLHCQLAVFASKLYFAIGRLKVYCRLLFT